MELIKVKRNFQLTIPQALRDKLRLAVGDYVEADIENGKIVIRPVQVVRAKKEEHRAEREKAYAALDEIWAKTKNEDPEEAAQLVNEAIKAVRKS